IDYSSNTTTARIIQDHYDRIGKMALAWITPGQTLYQAPQLTAAVEQALSYVYAYVYPGRSRPGNWWNWEIGIPNELGPALLFVQGAIDSTVWQNARDTFHFLIYDQPHMTGQNLIWSATNHMYLALMDNDPAHMAPVKDAFETQCAIQSGDGLQRDGSFHQHGAQLYNGGYGNDFSLDVSRYLRWADGASYQISGPALETFAQYFLDGSWWMIHHGAYELASRGRGITRGDYSTPALQPALLVLANVANTRQADAIAAAKHNLLFQSAYDLERAPLMPAVVGSPLAPVEPIGHRHFPESDFTIHRRSNYFASLKMFSSRVKNGENTNDEGLKLWCFSDGVTWILLDGTDYRQNNTLPTLDWQRLPGTTEERMTRADGSGLNTTQSKSFVGGAGAGGRGVSAMDFNAVNSALTAKKSWFFFDDEIVCLGSGVTCTSTNPVETTINQRRLAAPDALLTVDGAAQSTKLPWSASLPNIAWAQCEGFGYYFPGTATIQARRHEQQGAWADLNSLNGSSTIYSNPILTLWFDHGTQPSAAKYAYAVLPDKTAAQMAAYAAAAPISIARQTGTAHAVRHQTLGALGAVFWNAGTVAPVTVDSPCIVYEEQTATDCTLALSEPTHATTTIHVALDGAWQAVDPPSNVHVTTGATTTDIAFDCRNGANYVVSLHTSKSSARHWREYGPSAAR
ncbi:MAG: polysaccharide lyase 8 family protein, partial [Candidatus Sumerlaeota bacterium]|nr:polysaccharide lyase 8 family protein [Candidatus Sumerlaeota bacterium]